MSPLQPVATRPQNPRLGAFSPPPGAASTPTPVSQDDRVTLTGTPEAEPSATSSKPRRNWVHAGLLAAVALAGIAGAVAGATASPAAAVPVASVSASASQSNSTVLPHYSVKIGDRLTVNARRGDTMWNYASRFARDANGDGRIDGKELRAYLADLKAANGGSDRLYAGRPVKLPVTKNSGQALTFTIATQKAYAGKYPKIDWLSANFKGSGPIETFRIDVRDNAGKNHRFLVADDLEGSHPDSYQVMDEPLIKQFFPCY